MRILKWQIGIGNERTLEMPKGSKVLDVQMQGDDCCLWAMCPKDVPIEPRTFVTYVTGQSIDKSLAQTYVSTFQLHKAGLVFHVFENTN